MNVKISPDQPTQKRIIYVRGLNWFSLFQILSPRHFMIQRTALTVLIFLVKFIKLYFLKGAIVCKSCAENNGECGDDMVCDQSEGPPPALTCSEKPKVSCLDPAFPGCGEDEICNGEGDPPAGVCSTACGDNNGNCAEGLTCQINAAGNGIDCVDLNLPLCDPCEAVTCENSEYTCQLG